MHRRRRRRRRRVFGMIRVSPTPSSPSSPPVCFVKLTMPICTHSHPIPTRTIARILPAKRRMHARAAEEEQEEKTHKQKKQVACSPILLGFAGKCRNSGTSICGIQHGKRSNRKLCCCARAARERALSCVLVDGAQPNNV